MRNDGERTPIAYLRATVEFPLYAGDTLDRPSGRWNDFVYEEPGIAPGGYLATCRRQCKTITAEVVRVPKPPLEVTEEHREQGATDLQRAYPERRP